MANKKVYYKNLIFIFIFVFSFVMFVSCPQSIDSGLTDSYEIGDEGPAGGLIFYDDNLGYDFDGNDEIENNEKNLLSEYRYLEAAPSDYDDGTIEHYYHLFGYSRDNPLGSSQIVGTSSDFGSGKSNTSLLISSAPFYTTNSTNHSTTTNSYAAKLCDSFSYNSYNDWFLPSEQELNLLYLNLHKKDLGDFHGVYWSSSEATVSTVYVRIFTLDENNLFTRDRDQTNRVRPIRAF
jgi:hypothetical protein